jgi:hypothetical protein
LQSGLSNLYKIHIQIILSKTVELLLSIT